VVAEIRLSVIRSSPHPESLVVADRVVRRVPLSPFLLVGIEVVILVLAALLTLLQLRASVRL